MNISVVETAALPKIRVYLTVQGTVQGVGFRPFVYRLAREMGLSGWVKNSSEGVTIEVEGTDITIEAFIRHLVDNKPPNSSIYDIKSAQVSTLGKEGFEIISSYSTEDKLVPILPDIATCPDCLHELFDPKDRRYRYPFINCTNCGPRYSIITELPYDRSNTTMSAFNMCEKCILEYEDPSDRRFHAQPNACPDCGPHIELWNHNGKIIAKYDNALKMAINAIRDGKIVAVKGIGGFHLFIDARNQKAVELLRYRKHRKTKPFALMYPSLRRISEDCELSSLEESLLSSPQAPIVLLERRAKSKTDITSYVAPGNPYLGIMLPYTPLHHMIMRELNFPIVATSGNFTDEPICIEESETIKRLGSIADLFLIHNRKISGRVDDSIVRVIAGREMLLRRARGYAPLPIIVKWPTEPILAVGGYLKNSVALSIGNQVFVSPHIGDLKAPDVYALFSETVEFFSDLYRVKPEIVACDSHPDYLSTRYAESLRKDLSVITVQHHYTHVLACMAENGIDEPCLGVAWDGAGYGDDSTVWGGEFLNISDDSYDRAAHFLTFPLPGSDQASKEPRRSALGVLYTIYGESIFTTDYLPLDAKERHFLENPILKTFSTYELNILRVALEKKINSPLTSSAGRLFDAVASIIGLLQENSFEGEAAMALEFAVEPFKSYNLSYKFDFIDIDNGKGKLCKVIDWRPILMGILLDLENKTPSGLVSAKFHNSMVEIILAVAKLSSHNKIVLTGGCFQNRYLLEKAIYRLQIEGLIPIWHKNIPPNDGGLALGQVMAAKRGIRACV